MKQSGQVIIIDPSNITNYNLTHPELEATLIFWIFAAGHNAKSTAKGVEQFLGEIYSKTLKNTPFAAMRELDWHKVVLILSGSGLGCWRVKSRTLYELIHSNLNLKTCSIEDLEKVFGIGPKTARCFVMHSRPNIRAAGLDTHLLKFLRDKGISVPKSTPTGKRYKELEQQFLKLCDEANKTPAAYDLEIWRNYSKN